MYHPVSPHCSETPSLCSLRFNCLDDKAKTSLKEATSYKTNFELQLD